MLLLMEESANIASSKHVVCVPTLRRRTRLPDFFNIYISTQLFIYKVLCFIVIDVPSLSVCCYIYCMHRLYLMDQVHVLHTILAGRGPMLRTANTSP